MHPKQLLASYDLEPKKSLGQNFLFDENVLARIVDAAALTPQDQLLEIGPGLGSLTRLLARHVARVVAIELDGRFTPILQAQLAEFHNVELIHADILDQNPANLFQSQYKVVANVPFYITGAILRHLLGSTVKPSLMVLTVQKEVAERITAAPPNMSLLSVSVQYYGHPQIVTIIKAGAFWPRPDVDSCVIRIDLAQGSAESERSGPGKSLLPACSGRLQPEAQTTSEEPSPTSAKPRANRSPAAKIRHRRPSSSRNA